MHRKSIHDEAIAKAVAIMKTHPPMRLVTMAAMIGVERKRMSGILALCRTRKVPGFRKIHQQRAIYFYTIGEDKVLAQTEMVGKVRAPKVHAPVDLYRGWYNPLTGLTGSRLGV